MTIRFFLLFLIDTFIAVCFSRTVDAQQGNPFITNFQPVNIVDNTIFCNEHNNKNIMFYGTTQGVLVFNSVTWELIKTPNSVHSLKYNSQNDILYVGLKGGLGYIFINNQGIMEYQSIDLPYKTREEFNIILVNNSFVVFQSETGLYYFNPENNSFIKKWQPDGNYSLTCAFLVNNDLHVVTSDHFILVFKGDSTYSLNINELIENQVIFAIEVNDSNVILATSDASLYHFDGTSLNSFKYEDIEYVKTGILNGGIAVKDQNAIVLSTLAAGVVIIDKKTGKTKNIFNFQSGLPDDEIYSIGIDLLNGIWVAHLYGVSRIDLNFPVESYHNFPGLRGNVFSLYKNDTTFFVGTTEGLYYFAREEHFNEEEHIKYVPIRVPIKQIPVKKETSVPVSKASEESTEKDQKERTTGLISKIFKKKTDKNISSLAEDQATISKKNEEEIAPDQIKYTIKRKQIKEKVYKLQSVSHSYKKIQDFDEKVKDIVPLGNKILLSTNIGLYMFNGKEIQAIIKDEYIKSLFLSINREDCYALTLSNLYRITISDNEFDVKKLPVNATSFYSGCIDQDGNIWLGGDGELLKMDSESGLLIKNHTFNQISGPLFPLIDENGDILAYNKGIIYSLAGDSLTKENIFSTSSNTSIKVFYDYNNVLWFSEESFWTRMSEKETLSSLHVERFLTVFNDINKIVTDNENNVWVIDENKKIFKLNSYRLQEYVYNIELVIHYLKNKKGILLPPEDVELSYNENYVEVTISAPFFVKNQSIEYSYYIKGMTDKWSNWTTSSKIELTYLPTGKYTLELKARNIFGFESDIKSIKLNILPPFWQTKVFYILISVLFLVLLFLYIKFREQKLRKEREVLEIKVAERTAEIELQKSKLESQAMDITASITYAQRIQEALLPSNKVLEETLKDFFILFMPRDIVSGDFYWCYTEKNTLYLAAADCTGHGVPGAFMSMLGISFFNEVIKKDKLEDPAEILNKTRNLIIESLSYTDSFTEANDGMDVALCNIDFDRKVIRFAGAYNPLIAIIHENDKHLDGLNIDESKSLKGENNKVLIQISANRMPVSNSPLKMEKFETRQIPFKEGDFFYIFSDGFADQYGGEHGRKYFSKNLKKKLLEICDFPMATQKKLLKDEFEKWKGKLEQNDDVLIIGFRPL